jgi:hypothetical protein
MKVLLIILFGFFAAVVISCGSAKNASNAPAKHTFNFDYKTPAIARTGSANILVNLVRPFYARNFTNSSSELFTGFRQFMGKDIEELLIDKGFRVKGPYDSFDDMVFEDRKDADIAIEIEIVPEFTARQGAWKKHQAITFNAAYQAPIYYSYNGTVSLIGKINITGYEPLSREKIWVKSVPIPAIENINITTHNRLLGNNLSNEFYNDPNVYNSLGKALLEQYEGTFKKIDVQLDPREFETLKVQIKELKAKKGY